MTCEVQQDKCEMESGKELRENEKARRVHRTGPKSVNTAGISECRNLAMRGRDASRSGHRMDVAVMSPLHGSAFDADVGLQEIRNAVQGMGEALLRAAELQDVDDLGDFVCHVATPSCLSFIYL